MSSPEVLAAVTKALQNLLSGEIGGASVTTKPPSVARNGETGDQLNIFLYSVRHSPAFRNDPLPGKTKSGELAFPPLPLMLKYLITAYGKGDDDIYGQALLGKAMSILHDHPLLNRAEVDSGLDKQSERLRITPDPLTLDDMSKLWSSFQSAEYRLSAGYEVSVVLIDSKRSGKAPLPVLKRGDKDEGVQVVSSPPPSLLGIRFQKHKPSAELNDTITLLGKNLPDRNIAICFQHTILGKTFEVDIKETIVRKKTEIHELDFNLHPISNEKPIYFFPGFYLVSIAEKKEVKKNEENGSGKKEYKIFTRSNEIALTIAPGIESVSVENQIDGDKRLRVNCSPPGIKKEQSVSVLIGERIIQEIIQDTDPEIRTIIYFSINDIQPQEYLIRIRVDGVDSIPVDFSGAVPKFKPKVPIS